MYFLQILQIFLIKTKKFLDKVLFELLTENSPTAAFRAKNYTVMLMWLHLDVICER